MEPFFKGVRPKPDATRVAQSLIPMPEKVDEKKAATLHLPLDSSTDGSQVILWEFYRKRLREPLF